MTTSSKEKRQFYRGRVGGENERRKVRAHILRELGVTRRHWDLAYSPRRFREALESIGRDPSQYGELAVTRTGGKPRGPDTPEALRRRARYAYLRECGLSSMDSTRGQGSDGIFAYTVRRLVLQGKALPPLPPELERCQTMIR